MGRVRYCKTCKRHIKGFDHHCPAFGNCIGRNKHLDAYLDFLLLMSLMVHDDFLFDRNMVSIVLSSILFSDKPFIGLINVGHSKVFSQSAAKNRLFLLSLYGDH